MVHRCHFSTMLWNNNLFPALVKIFSNELSNKLLNQFVWKRFCLWLDHVRLIKQSLCLPVKPLSDFQLVKSRLKRCWLDRMAPAFYNNCLWPLIQGCHRSEKVYFESGKIDILKESLKGKTEIIWHAWFNTIEGWKKHLESLWSQRYFSLMKKANLFKTYQSYERVERKAVSSC